MWVELSSDGEWEVGAASLIGGSRAVRQASAWAAVTLVLALLGIPIASSILSPAAAQTTEAGCTVTSQGRTATVKPCEGIRDGQWLELSWTGVRPTAGDNPVNAITFLQCKANPASAQDCYLRPLLGGSQLVADQPATVGGTGSVLFPVLSDPLLANGQPTFVCNSDNPCSVGIFPHNELDNQGPEGEQPLNHVQQSFDKRLVVPIKFAPPGGCSSVALGPAGLADVAARRALLVWQGAVCSAPYEIAPASTTRSSFDALDAFVQQDEKDDFDDVDFAVTAVPLTDEQRAVLTQKKIKFTVVPITLSGLAVGSNFGRIPNLRLSAEHAARAAVDLLRTTEEIQSIQVNPEQEFPSGSIRTYKTAGFTSGIRTLTSWFKTDQKATEAWEFGTRFQGPEAQALPSDSYPRFDDQVLTGEETVAFRMANRLQSLADTPISDNLLGWMDSSIANFFGLPPALIPNRNPAANPDPVPDFEFVGPTVDSLTKGAEAAVTNSGPDAEFLTIDYATAAPGAYPMPVISYMVVRTDLARKGGEDGIKKSADLQKFLEYILGDGQKVLPGGYAPLPPALVAMGTSRLKNFQKPPEPAGSTTLPQVNAAAVTTAPAAAAQGSSSVTPTTQVTTTAPPQATTTRAVTTTTPPRAANVSQSATTLPSESDDEGEAGEEEQEALGTEEEEVASLEETVAEEEPFSESPSLTDLGDSSDFQETSAQEALPPVSFPERIARAVGLLQGSASRFLLPVILFVGLAALLFGSMRRAPEMLRGWNPTFENDFSRYLREVIDRMLQAQRPLKRS